MAHRALATQNKVAYLCFQCLDHPPYSPDLAPSGYHLFLGLKKIERKVGRAKDLSASRYFVQRMSIYEDILHVSLSFIASIGRQAGRWMGG
jgi:hypothetical protein